MPIAASLECKRRKTQIPNIRRTLQLIIVGLLAITLFSSFSVPVAGHASLESSDPVQNSSIDQAPPRVTLSFTESLETQSSTLRVLDIAGTRVDDQDLAFSPGHLSMSVGIPSLPQGVYTVSWEVVSAFDGHPTSGSFSFGVKTIVPPPPQGPSTLEPSLASLIPEALIRWTLFLGQTLVVGALLFQQLVLGSRLNENDLASSRDKFVRIRCTRRILILTLLGAALALSGAIGLVILQWTSSAGAVSVNEFVLATRLGLTSVVRLGLGGAIFLMIFYTIRSGRTKPVVVWASTASGAALLLTTSLSGHNAAVSFNPTVAVVSDFLHLVGVASWIGGLFSFAIIFPILKEERLHQHLSRLIPQFSKVAMTSVGMISLTGIYSAWLQVGSFTALLSTLYGTTLIVKVSLMMPIVLLGALTQLIWHPRIAKGILSPRHTGSALAGLGSRIIRSVRMETVLAAVLLLTVGLLTALPPAVQVSPYTGQSVFQSKVLTEQADDVRVTLSIFPFRVGENSFEVILRDDRGRPTPNVLSVIFDFTFLDASLGTTNANGEPAGEGRFLLQGPFLSMPGNWSIDVKVRRTDAFDALADFETSLEAYPGLDTARMLEVLLPDSDLSVLDTKVDGAGTVWFTMPAAGSIGRFQPRLKEHPEIFQSNYTGSSPNTLAFDGGKVWFTDALRHSVVSFDPASEQFHEFPIPTPGGQPTGIAFDSSGTAWVTETLFSQLRGFTPQNGSFTSPIFTPTGSSRPGAVAIDQRQRVWFAEETGGKIGMLNSTTRTIIEYSQPDAVSITGIAVAPNQDIWLAEHGSSRITRFDPETSSSSPFPLTNLSGLPWALEVDSQGNVWFVEHAGKIGFYDVGSDTFQEFTIPTLDSGPRNLSLDQFGNVWFGESKGKLGVLALEPGSIGLSSPGQDTFYTLASAIIGIGVAVGTVSMFALHRKRTRELGTDRSQGAETRAS